MYVVDVHVTGGIWVLEFCSSLVPLASCVGTLLGARAQLFRARVSLLRDAGACLSLKNYHSLSTSNFLCPHDPFSEPFTIHIFPIRLASRRDSLNARFVFCQSKDHDSASALCNSVVSFAQEEMQLVAGAEGKGLPLVELLLSLTACDLVRIPVLTLDFWLELQVRGGVT